MERIERLIEFVRLTEKFRNIERIVFSKDHARQESDPEHSFQLALAAWYLIETEKLPLDAAKAMRYALVHDLVEIYAGDTYAYEEDAAARDSKKEREERSLERIAAEFPEFPELARAMRDYEERSDPESRFVYALDKMLPPINIFLDGGRAHREHEVTLAMFMANKGPKVAVSPDLKPYFDELVKYLTDRESDAFFVQGG